VQRAGGIGRMLGIFKAHDDDLDGSRRRGLPSRGPEQCQGGRDAGRPRRDVRQMTGELYRTRSAGFQVLPTAGARAVYSIRYSTEMGMMRQTDC
jgi:hypothetical protein